MIWLCCVVTVIIVIGFILLLRGVNFYIVSLIGRYIFVIQYCDGSRVDGSVLIVIHYCVWSIVDSVVFFFRRLWVIGGVISVGIIVVTIHTIFEIFSERLIITINKL